MNSKISGPFDAIFIDFYGTICAGDRQAVEHACDSVVADLSLPVTPREFAVVWGEEFFRILENSNHADFRTLHECELLSLKRAVEPFGRKIDPVPHVAILEAYWRNPPLHPEAKEFLSRVDRPICCVSNADEAPLAAAIENHGLCFDAVISSEVARCYKPEPDIFRRAADAMNLKGETVLHIGDSLHSDVAGADAAGIASAWVCREDRIHDIGTCQPDHKIANLSELLVLLAPR